MMDIHSMKFGGTSMGSAESIQQCAAIVVGRLQRHSVVVVVSAMSGVTNDLYAMVELAFRQKPRLLLAKMDHLMLRHKSTLQTLVGDELQAAALWQEQFVPLFEKLRVILYGSSLVGDMTEKTQARVCAYGEKFSSRLMVLALQQAGCQPERFDGEQLLRSDSEFMESRVRFPPTYQACRKLLLPAMESGRVPVVAGFTARDKHGNTTLLGRGGSDYTASIMAMALGGQLIEIWTDVDGIMSADPRRVPHIVCWQRLGIDVVAEMAYSGAKVVHPKSISAAVNKKIPVLVANTFAPEKPGTMIIPTSDPGIRGVVASEGNVLVHIDNPQMLDEVGFIAKFLDRIASLGLAFDVCATSETSFTFSLKSRSDAAKLAADFKGENLKMIEGVGKISLVGQGIGRDPRLLAQVFALSERYHCPLNLVSIGESGYNVTLMLADQRTSEMLNILHSELLPARASEEL